MKFSEFNVGDTFTTQKVTLTKQDIIDFANQYDPQYFHINESAANKSPYGSIIASGFQTLSVVWAEWIKMDILGTDCLGGIGAEIKWTKPVKPNDQLYGKFTVIEKKASSDNLRGLVTFEIIISNQKQEVVLEGASKIYIAN